MTIRSFVARTKPFFVADEYRVRTIKGGPARGCQAWLNRRVDLQRELGLYESELHGVYRTNVHRGTVAFDIGAADGLVSLAMAGLGARVYAFEPDPVQVERLRSNLGLNPDLDVEVIPEAATAETLSVARAGFVKIDVEGAEVEVLEALHGRPTIVVETHSQQLERDCLELLGTRRYHVRIVEHAWWRRFYPEWRPIEHNRWIVATTI